MELISIILVIIVIVVVFNVLNKTNMPAGVQAKPLSLSLAPVKQTNELRIPKELINSSTKGMNKPPPVKVNQDNLGDFPTPPTTSNTRSLSPDTKTDLSIINNPDLNLSSSNNPISDILRTTQPKKDSHYPKYYRKDYLSGNTVGTTELSGVGKEDEPCLAWSDSNVSNYPKYYKSNFTGGLTSPGSFFDSSNQYVDITGPRSDASIGDVCYKDRDGEKVCLVNDKLQNVPPSLIEDSKRCGFLNSIGLMQYTNKLNNLEEKVMNGGILYENVKASKPVNSEYGVPIKQPKLSCNLI